MRKALIRLGDSCNNNCSFCHIGPKKGVNLTTESAKKKILQCKKLGYNFVLFSGGEPTIRKDLKNLAKFMNENSMDFGLITNGRMLAYREIVQDLVKNNLKYVYCSFLGSNAEIHNKITNSESFEQVKNGIANIINYQAVKLIVNVTVTSANLDDLRNIVDLAAELGVKNLKFTMVDCKGNAMLDDNIMPCLSLAMRKIKDAIDYALQKEIKPLIGDFPLCLAEEYSKYIDNMQTNQIEVMSNIDEKDFCPVDDDDRTKIPCCSGCKHKCKGVDRNYLKIRGDKEIIDCGRIGNSIPFFSENKLKSQDCQLIPKDKRKIVQKGIGLYNCCSDNFSDGDINIVKDKSQVYITKNTHHFSLQKMQQLDKCKKCDEKDKCARIFECSADNVIQEYFQQLENEIKKINGKTLDIGSGKICLKDLFKNMKNIEYLGVDPNGSDSDGLKVIKSTFEEFDAKDDSFDNILLLGSYNHLRNIDSSFNKIYKLLRKGGNIILTDSELMIVLKEKKSSPTKKGFEHYRAHDCEQAASILKSHNFRIIQKTEVTEKTCNNWMITARK